MAQDHLSPAQWISICEAIAQQCERRAMTALHFTFLYGQEIDDALAHLPAHCVERGRTIAEQFGYENHHARVSLASWISNGRKLPSESGFGNLA